MSQKGLYKVKKYLVDVYFHFALLLTQLFKPHQNKEYTKTVTKKNNKLRKLLTVRV